MSKIGYMQGRLSDVVNGKIQSFPKHTWEKEIVLGAENDFRLIEWTLDQEELFKNPFLTKKGQLKIKKLINIHKCKILSVTGDCFMQAPFWKSHKEDEKALKKIFFLVIKACKDLDLKMLVLPCVDNSSIENEDQEKKFISFFNENKDLLNFYNIKIAIESDYRPTQLFQFIKKLPKNIFYINYDIGNSASLGFDPKKEINTYGNLISNVHVKDRKFMGLTVPLGEGDANFKTVYKYLAKKNYKGNFILQTARDKNEKHLESLLKYRDKVRIDAKNFIKFK
tara:strand:+ start:10270 stop:11112 length:843 start_codon:yes stop_codon:yes gene_type:complete